MIIGHGIDLVDVARIAASIDRHGQRLLDRVFTPAEQAYAAGSKRRMEHLAARFAAKEAALKALATGWRSGIAWTDVEVVSQPSGAPALRITGRAAEIAADRGVTAWHISLTHTEAQAMASVIACGRAPPHKDNHSVKPTE
jgi:holo-[acyl-carrier protein] synthase